MEPDCSICSLWKNIYITSHQYILEYIHRILQNANLTFIVCNCIRQVEKYMTRCESFDLKSNYTKKNNVNRETWFFFLFLFRKEATISPVIVTFHINARLSEDCLFAFASLRTTNRLTIKRVWFLLWYCTIGKIASCCSKSLNGKQKFEAKHWSSNYYENYNRFETKSYWPERQVGQHLFERDRSTNIKINYQNTTQDRATSFSFWYMKLRN